MDWLCFADATTTITVSNEALATIGVAATAVAGGIGWLFTTMRSDWKEDREKYHKSLETVVNKVTESEDEKVAVLSSMRDEIKGLAPRVEAAGKSADEAKRQAEEAAKSAAKVEAEMRTWRSSWQQAHPKRPATQ